MQIVLLVKSGEMIEKLMRRPFHAERVRVLVRWGLFVLWLSISICPLEQTHAAFTTNLTADGTLGTIVTQTGKVYDINGGTIKGTNQFHSLRQFSVGTGDTASFNGPAGIQNILGRVTGGQQSQIDGTIKSTITGANLYLMNPAGVLFGPNASLNLSGSFHVTTADYLRLADNVRFNAIPDAAKDGLLTTAPIAAFGFLGPNPASITVQGSTGSSALAVEAGNDLALISGDITVTGHALSAPGGAINLASVASTGEMITNTTSGQRATPILNGFTALGNISLTQGATIDTNANRAGPIFIRGGQLVMDASSITTRTDEISGGGIDMTVQNVQLANGAKLETSTTGAGNAGKINLNVNSLTAANGAEISSSSTSPTANAGRAGSITIQGLAGPGSSTRTVSFDNSTVHTTTIGGTAVSPPLSIAITADTVVLSNGTQITATTHGAAPAGDITFNVRTLTTQPGSHLVPINPNLPDSQVTGVLIASDSTSLDAGAGHASKITIQGLDGPDTAATSISLDGCTISTRVFGGTAATIPATITLTADSVALSNSALILPPTEPFPAATLVATSLGPAPAGSIAFNVNTLRVNVNPDGTPITGALRVFINSPSGSPENTAGPAGTVSISGVGQESTDAAKLVTFNNTQISTVVVAGTVALRPPAITITADTVALTNDTGIFSGTLAAAPAGSVAFNVNTLRVNVNPDGTLINNGLPRVYILSFSASSDSTAGPAGTLSISGLGKESTDAAKLLALNNIEFNTTILGGTVATIPGSIILTGDTLTLSNSRRVTSDTSGGAPAGNITFNVKKLTADLSTISSSSTRDSSGAAGSVVVQGQDGAGTVADMVILDGSSVITSTAGSGKGGAIHIGGTSVILNNGTSVSATATGTGDAGNINISAGDQFVSRNSVVTTQAAQADGGNIVVRAGNLVQLVNSRITTSVGSGAGNGGNISIDPQFVILQDSQILANAFGGNGGNITITSDVFLADPSSIVSASSTLGINGTIDIRSPVQNLSGSLSPLPSSLLKITPLTSACAARAQGGSLSSFTVAGRDSVPVEAGGWLPSPVFSGVNATEVTSSPFDNKHLALSPAILLAALQTGCQQQ
jgi:filamentous hemagglutinin family protein